MSRTESSRRCMKATVLMSSRMVVPEQSSNKTTMVAKSEEEGWPWMKGIDVAVADPIPLPDFDKRVAVKDLITENRKLIDQVKKGLVDDPLYQRKKHDDLWCLRFLLSHKKKPKAALKAAKTTLAFRKEHCPGDRDIRAFPPHNHNDAPCEAISKFMSEAVADGAISLIVPDKTRGVIGLLTVAGIDYHKMVENVEEKYWLPAFCYISEWSFQWSDYVTRTTGRLTKSIRLSDTTGLRLHDLDIKIFKRYGNAMGTMEDCYPQLLQGICICNAPGWVQVPWRFVRPILPARVQSKIDFVDPIHREKERDRILQYIAKEHLPERFGGSYPIWPVEIPPPL